MKRRIRYGSMIVLLILFSFLWAVKASADVLVQCPGDTDGDGISEDPNIVCRHITGGDGYTKMADGLDLYIFSFGDADGVPAQEVIADLTLKAQMPAPTIAVKQGQELYLTMTNVGMVVRPDLFDPHSVHWHGFPNAAPIFDGLPEPSPTANMGNSFTYYYNAVVPGTYFYHCHVEAAEHMQMGMIGNLWVTPAQDGTSVGGFTKFAYNDNDGSTGYDVAYPLLLTGFDSFFHIASDTVQALPFAAMYDEYPMINGRGYPDTINPNNIANQNGFEAQKVSSLMTATAGQRILLRVCNISTTHQYSFATTLGVPMKVVGRGAAILRGPDGKDTSMLVNVLNVGGGQAYDVILDTAGVAPGTYFLYTTDLANLSNGKQERGGIMTEIVINPL
ncbi:MAG: multicopper oxidase domain-containing protein [Desulfobacteraceae bacterium]|jgi:FtsP/CotA-like multicopper oxidase with cupredoxin domain|nr:multicopper oxidase domain-containing protein [Desulfobacteraceae bacterium]